MYHPSVPRLLRLTVLAAALSGLVACNTTAGVGKDVTATGKAVTDTANKVKSGL